MPLGSVNDSFHCSAGASPEVPCLSILASFDHARPSSLMRLVEISRIIRAIHLPGNTLRPRYDIAIYGVSFCKKKVSPINKKVFYCCPESKSEVFMRDYGGSGAGFPLGEKRRDPGKKGVPGSRDSRFLLAEYLSMGIYAQVCILKVALIQTLSMCREIP